MASENEYEKIMEEGKRVVSYMKGKRFETCTLSRLREGVSESVIQLQELAQHKQDVKNKFHKTVMMNTFMKNLSQPRQGWEATTKHLDDELQSVKKVLEEAQHTMDAEKKQLIAMDNVVAEAMTMYQENLNMLEDRVQHLGQMVEEFQTLQQSCTNEVEAFHKEIQEELVKNTMHIKECQKQLLHLKHSKAEVELRISLIEDEVQHLNMTFDADQDSMDTQCLARLQKSITTMKSLCGVTCSTVGSNIIIVEFPPRQSLSESPSSADTPGEDIVLQVTLTFQETGLGAMRLSDVKSNVDSFEMDDLWKRDGEWDSFSLPKLISDIKLRWFFHVPLLTEINHIRGRFAVDWIQDANILRVIVGKGGGIVCSLEIPPGYPSQGQVKLTSIMGSTDNVSLDDLKPSKGSRLEDWVHFLQDQFGKP